MSKKYFVVSDVHGFYDKFMKALNENGWDFNNPEHILIHCGDLLDRGPKPTECLKFVNSIPSDRKILILGNHEDMMVECLKRGRYDRQDIFNKIVKTIQDVTGLNNKNSVIVDQIDAMKNNPDWNEYIKSCVDYAEIGDNIFVHGWIPTKVEKPDSFFDIIHPKYIYDGNWRDANKAAWKASRWDNGMSLWDKGIRVKGKTVYSGHWHSSYGHANLHHDGAEFPDEEHPELKVIYTPFIDEGIVALDACTNVSGFINCVVIDE